MSDFYFYAEGAVHEGGSKYYQVIRVGSNRFGRSAVITHWGKMHPGAPKEPKHHGQTKVEYLTNSGVYVAKSHISRKSKNGYGGSKGGLWNKTANFEFEDQTDFEIAVHSWFSKEDAMTIIQHICGMTELIEPIDKVEDVTAAAPVVDPATKSENWGTW